MPRLRHHNLLELKWQQRSSLNESVHTFPPEAIGREIWGGGRAPLQPFRHLLEPNRWPEHSHQLGLLSRSRPHPYGGIGKAGGSPPPVLEISCHFIFFFSFLQEDFYPPRQAGMGLTIASQAFARNSAHPETGVNGGRWKQKGLSAHRG